MVALELTATPSGLPNCVLGAGVSPTPWACYKTGAPMLADDERMDPELGGGVSAQASNLGEETGFGIQHKCVGQGLCNQKD